MDLYRDIFAARWIKFHRNVFDWWNRRRNDQLIKVNSVRERSISILQNRYGYSRENAIYQLDKYYSRAWLG